MKLIKYISCWSCTSKTKIINEWFPLKSLKKEKQDTGHIDYNCPRCGKVIICEKRLK